MQLKRCPIRDLIKAVKMPFLYLLPFLDHCVDVYFIAGPLAYGRAVSAVLWCPSTCHSVSSSCPSLTFVLLHSPSSFDRHCVPLPLCLGGVIKVICGKEHEGEMGWNTDTKQMGIKWAIAINIYWSDVQSFAVWISSSQRISKKTKQNK